MNLKKPDNIDLWFSNIFTGCYTVQFHLGGQKYVTGNHVFIKTSDRDLVTQPQVICKYDTYSDKRHEITSFTFDISLLADVGKFLQVRFIPISSDKPCIWKGEWFEHIWNVSLINDVSKDNNNNCSLKEGRRPSGEYIKTVQCNFQIQIALPTGYCSVFELVDDRCSKIVSRLDTEPCIWIKRCVNSFENAPHIDNTKVIASSSYLLLPIIAVLLIVSTIAGAVCFLRYVRIRKEEVNLYVNPQHDDFLNPTCLKSTNFDIVDGSEKGVDHDNTACDDIILLYTKSSTSFMTLMKDFRETLAKICSCSVYDWHDGAEWNNVAKVGAVLWFTELFNSGCRVVWIDTPTSRSVVMSNSRESNTNVNKVNKYYEIGDFRDVAFPVVLDLAKRNTRNVIHQYRRHFVVRFGDLENTRNLNDPFLDLSPHARYRMPQHLMQLCSDLSVVKPILSKYQMKAEQDLLQQRLESLM
ncbi:uncharacterized protein LOC109858966 isoform X2 [Pseudomyrmex gracilis]|uniref:uncharacterized protein LOC109858966 isoform X2 n=1 Tax=Pseudomyrmex gracilis TaxID=219809 RepID=UPI000995CF6C|nr:uncharacterized protein LOC109858966 isoform X2 [Pseudomyrmex gracilis]